MYYNFFFSIFLFYFLNWMSNVRSIPLASPSPHEIINYLISKSAFEV